MLFIIKQMNFSLSMPPSANFLVSHSIFPSFFQGAKHRPTNRSSFIIVLNYRAMVWPTLSKNPLFFVGWMKKLAG